MEDFERCPYCRANVSYVTPNGDINFRCGSYVNPERPNHFVQTEECKKDSKGWTS